MVRRREKARPKQIGETIMSTFIRSAIGGLALIGAVATAAIAQEYTPYDEEQGIVRVNPDNVWETIQERGE